MTEKNVAKYLTSSAYREFPQLAFHGRARRIVTLVVAESVVFVVDDFAVGVEIARDAQFAEMLNIAIWKIPTIKITIRENHFFFFNVVKVTSSTGSGGSCWMAAQ